MLVTDRQVHGNPDFLFDARREYGEPFFVAVKSVARLRTAEHRWPVNIGASGGAGGNAPPPVQLHAAYQCGGSEVEEADRRLDQVIVQLVVLQELHDFVLLHLMLGLQK